MRSEIATFLAFGLSVSSVAAAPTYSCFDPPDEGQTNPLGEGMEDVVGSECCEALIDESDMEAGRIVIWDPVNCNHGPGEFAIAEAPLCRAHDTDGCRFCHDSCVGFEGLCITCDEVLMSTSSPTPSPFDFGVSFSPDTPAPVMVTPTETGVPFDIFPETLAPVTPTPADPATPGPVAPLPGPVTGAPVEPPTAVEECACVDTLSEEERAVLTRRSKQMVCDSTCSDPIDPVWGVLNCDYFALGQNCRACSDICVDQGFSIWLDQDGFPCKPCFAI